MTTGKFDDAFSRGDVMRRLHALERKVELVTSGRHLEAASVGRGGLRIQGGKLTIQDILGDDMFRAGGDPGELFLRQDLLTPLAIAILADRISSKTAFGSVSTTSTSMTELDDGPVVPNVSVGASGRCLVHMATQLSAESLTSAGVGNNHGGRYSFRVSGATTVAPSAANSVAFFKSWDLGSSSSGFVDSFRMGTTLLLQDLSPGQHTFTAMYATLSAFGTAASFAERNLTIVAF